jgi:tetratricopeptide (TPR) repeat protein
MGQTERSHNPGHNSGHNPKPVNETQTATPFGTAHPSDYQRLVRFLIAPGPAFGFAIARYVDPRVRDRLIQAANTDAKAADVLVKTLNLTRLDLETSPNLSQQLERQVSTAPAPNAVMVIQLERFLIDPLGQERVSPSISKLNQARDALPRRVPARVVLWLTDAAANAFATHAQDLYDVALTHFRFEDRDTPAPVTDYGKGFPNWLMAASDEDRPRLQREAALLETVFKSASGDASKADAAFRIAHIRAVLNEGEKAKEWFELTLGLYEAAKDLANRGKTHLQYGDFLDRWGQPDQAMDQFQTALGLFESTKSEEMIAESQDRIADILQSKGRHDEALELRQEKILPVVLKFQNLRNEAVTRGKIADILEARGQLDEALEIRQNQMLPVYQKLGDIRGEAFTRGKIANILEARGQLDEALEIRQNQTLPVYQKLGDIRNEAVTREQIADILQARGQLDEALEIRQNQTLPVYQKLGDIQSEAFTRGKIADILEMQGLRDKAIFIYRNDVLPIHESIGNKRALLVDRVYLAQKLILRGLTEDSAEIISLFTTALNAAREMGIPEAEQIENVMHQYNLTIPKIDQ